MYGVLPMVSSYGQTLGIKLDSGLAHYMANAKHLRRNSRFAVDNNFPSSPPEVLGREATRTAPTKTADIDSVH